jgi:RNA polymerase sigma-70 factor (ECF subfamily)
LSGDFDSTDPQDVERWLARYRRRLEFWVSARMGPLLRAKLSPADVVQETCLEAQKSLDRFEDQGPGSFLRWLFSIAENRLRDLHKYHAAQKRHPAREMPIAGRATDDSGIAGKLAGKITTPGTRAMRREQVALLIEAVDRLPEDLREIVLLHIVEERSFREIGELLGKSSSTVQTWYCRALDSLRRHLEESSG